MQPKRQPSHPERPAHPAEGYWRPASLAEALARLAATPPPVIVAGGTDFYPARAGRAVTESVLDLSGIAELRGIQAAQHHFRIGALTTWADLAGAALPPLFDGLKAAAREVGGVQVQNAGTIAGNVCNASPAADGIPPLLTLDAAVEIASRGGARTLPVADFVLGNRRTALRPGELVAALRIPKPRLPVRTGFSKLGARRYLVISIVMAAAALETGADGTIARAAIAVGACSPVARRLPLAEAALAGLPLTAGAGDAVQAAHLAPLAPIGDVRGGAAYRREAALVLVRRLIEQLAS